MKDVNVQVPGDKSISHRALICAALASGTSVLRNVSRGEDVQSTARALRALGVDIPELTQGDAELRIAGVGVRGLRSPDGPIDCGNSGTTARLLLGVLAGLPISAVLTGDASLRARPMRRVTAPLAAAGAAFDELETADRLPLRVRGAALQAISYESPVASAQIKSALLFAGLTAGVSVRVREPILSRDHTERMLRAQGADVESASEGDGAVVRLNPPAALQPLQLTVPGDFSAAAFFLAAGILGGRTIRMAGTGVNSTRTGMLDVLARAGASVALHNQREESGEPVADLVVQGGAPLHAMVVRADDVPGLIDELPVIAALAARAAGVTEIRGAGELRVKETDRIAALATNLRTLGVGVEEHDDGLSITGTAEPLRGRVRAFGDHRIAMAFGVLGVQPENTIEIDDRDVVGISFPDFWTQLDACASRESA